MTTAIDKIGKYAIVREIAQGGFGRTLLAENSEGKRVVLKQFNPIQQNEGSQALSLFKQECDLLKKVGSHDQIPSFIDYFELEGDRKFISQQWIDGLTLEQELKEQGVFSEAQIIALLNDLLPVFSYIHLNNLIHRDIKPDNIIRRSVDGKLFLVDFGAAKAVSETVLAKTGTMIGSALYTAPEQVGGKATYTSDLYSLGLTCIHLLTNMSPINLHDIGEDKWIWQDYCTGEISAGLADILNKMLERRVNHRYRNAQAVLENVQKLISSTVDQQMGVLQEYLVEKSPSLAIWREQVEQNAKQYESYSEEKQRQLLIDHIRAQKFFPFLPADSILGDAERIKGKKFDAVAILSGRQYLIREKDLKTGRDTIKYKWGPEWLGKPDHPSGGPLASVKRKAVAALAVTAVFTTGIAVWRNTPNVRQESPDPVAIEQPAQEPESGFLPRVPMLDDLKDELVADVGVSTELASYMNTIFTIMKIMLILMFLGAFLVGLGMSARWMINTERN